MFDSILSMSKLTEKIAKGLGGWLMYEHHSHRADLFSEKYLVSGIGNILAGNYRDKIIAEFTHPILKFNRAGRPPQLDFVLEDSEGSIKLALESKWVGTKSSTSPRTIDILWDLIRLELLNHKYDTGALFILAGKKSQIDEVFNQKTFADETSLGKRRPLLPTRKQGTTLNLLTGSIERVKMLATSLKKYKMVQAPSQIAISGAKIFPEVCENFENQVCVWSISSVKNAKRYKYADLLERITKREKKLGK